MVAIACLNRVKAPFLPGGAWKSGLDIESLPVDEGLQRSMGRGNVTGPMDGSAWNMMLRERLPLNHNPRGKPQLLPSYSWKYARCVRKSNDRSWYGR